MRLKGSHACLIAASLALAAAAAVFAFLRGRRPSPAPPVCAEFPPVSARDRLLVLAPHEDDETLAAGGLIQRAIAAGARVHVAYLTNGDHNQLAFIVYRRRPWLTPRINRRMGEVRRGEATRAMRFLGVPAGELSFLGYPDNDTLSIWCAHWGAAPPLRSLLTDTVRVPYRDTLGFGKPYTGESIAADISGVLRDFRPTLVLVSHPADGNPDHRAYYLFLRLALRELEGKIPSPTVYTYPVHMGPWPRPHRYHPEAWLSFPRRLAAESRRATAFVLTPDEVRRKYDAIRLYPSQMADCGYWLTAFARRNEFFIRDEPIPLALGGWWTGRREAMETAETAAYEAEDRTGGLGGVSCRADERGIHLRIEPRHAVEKALGVSVSLFGLRRGTPFADMPKLEMEWLADTLHVRDRGREIAGAGIGVETAGGLVTFSVPWETAGNPDAVFTQLRGMIGPVALSHTGWTLFAISRRTAAGTR